MITPLDLLANLAPGALILASTLPWEFIWTRNPRAFATGPLARGDFLSGQMRALIAVVMMVASLMSFFTNHTGEIVTFGGLAVLLLMGIVFVRATAWTAAALLCSCAMLVVLEPKEALLGCLWLAAIVYLWQEVGRLARTQSVAVALGLTFALLALLSERFAVSAVEGAAPICGLALGLISLSALALGELWRRSQPLPVLVASQEGEGETQPVELHQLVGIRRRFTLGHLVGVLVGVTAMWFAAVLDARDNPVSGLVIATLLLGAWGFRTTQMEIRGELAAGLMGAALLTASVTILVAAEFREVAVLIVIGLGAGALSLSLGVNSLPSAVCAVGCLAIAPLLAGIPLLRARFWDGGEAAVGLLAAAALVACARLLLRAHGHFGRERLPSDTPDPLGAELQAWLCGSGALLMLLILGRGPLVRETFVSCSWGIVGVALLAGGFALQDRKMRFISLGVFALTVARVFVRDLAGVAPLTRTVAFFGVGLLMVAAAVAYGFLRNRLRTETDSEDS